MKHMMILILFLSTLYSKVIFEKNTKYTCSNTYNIHNGKQIYANVLESQIKPFSFTIKREMIITSNNIIYDFRMQRGARVAYSNDHYLLLLTPDMEVGLVPKKQKGAIQFYFTCK